MTSVLKAEWYTDCRYLFFQLKSHAYLYDDTQSTTDSDDESSVSEVEVAEITPLWAVGLLLASTAVVAVCAEFLVSSIDEMVKSSGVSQAFIGLIVLPIVGNAAEVSSPPSSFADSFWGNVLMVACYRCYSCV